MRLGWIRRCSGKVTIGSWQSSGDGRKTLVELLKEQSGFMESWNQVDSGRVVGKFGCVGQRVAFRVESSDKAGPPGCAREDVPEPSWPSTISWLPPREIVPSQPMHIPHCQLNVRYAVKMLKEGRRSPKWAKLRPGERCSSVALGRRTKKSESRPLQSFTTANTKSRTN